MLLLIVLAAAVLVGVGAVVARHHRARPGPPAQNGDGFSGFGAGSGLSSSAVSDDSLPFNLAAGSLVVSEQIQADHAAQSPHHDARHDAPHHSPDPVTGAGSDAGSSDSGWSDSGGGDAGGGGGDP